MISSLLLIAQAPPTPLDNPSNGENGPVGGAPIGSGLVLLIAMAAGYGGKKIFETGKMGKLGE